MPSNLLRRDNFKLNVPMKEVLLLRLVVAPVANIATIFPLRDAMCRGRGWGPGSGGGGDGRQDDGGGSGGGGGGSSLGGSAEQTEFAFRLHLYKAKILILQQQVRCVRGNVSIHRGGHGSAGGTRWFLWGSPRGEASLPHARLLARISCHLSRRDWW